MHAQADDVRSSGILVSTYTHSTMGPGSGAAHPTDRACADPAASSAVTGPSSHRSAPASLQSWLSSLMFVCLSDGKHTKALIYMSRFVYKAVSELAHGRPVTEPWNRWLGVQVPVHGPNSQRAFHQTTACYVPPTPFLTPFLTPARALFAWFAGTYGVVCLRYVVPPYPASRTRYYYGPEER